MGEVRDFERSLTMEGISTARALGRKLVNDRFNPHQIVCSPAVRAYDTAVNLSEELNINEQEIQKVDKLYEASVRELLEVVNDMEPTTESAILVGHNPSISYFAEMLTSSGIGNMEPCGLVMIDFEGITWKQISQASGTFVAYYHPNREV
ncbi:MAG: histidine phosphatase family protein [Bacteroidota bacterium]